MNIKTRIEKLEDQTKPDGFCQCKDPKNLYFLDLTSDAVTNEPQVIGPDICHLCNKEIEKVVLVLKDEY